MKTRFEVQVVVSRRHGMSLSETLEPGRDETLTIDAFDSKEAIIRAVAFTSLRDNEIISTIQCQKENRLCPRDTRK
jgi:hypothetical protein